MVAKSENNDTEPANIEEKGTSKKEKLKSEANELVEYSPDELQDVNKDVLNAEITELEGKKILFYIHPLPLVTNAWFTFIRGNRESEAKFECPR